MAGRRNKVGLDYIELDCHMDEKIDLIEAEFGLKGFAIIVKLYQSIYSGFGYYCEWTPEISVLWAYRLGCSHSVGGGNVGNVYEECVLPGFPKNLINEVVAASTRRNIFSAELFQRYGILTSSGIQKRYFRATSRREEVELIKEYLLFPVDKNSKNVVINSIYDDINKENVDEFAQSREEKSKDNICAQKPHNESKDIEIQLESDFEIIYSLYPKKRGRTVAFCNYKQWVSKKGKIISGKRYRLTNRQIYKAVKKYIQQQEEIGQDDLQYWKNFDTLMGRQLLDFVELEEDQK